MKLRLQTKIRISSGKVRVKNFATSHKEVATPPEKTIRLNSRKVLLAMVAIVERGRVYEITNLLYFTLTRTHFLLDRGLQLLPYHLEHNPQTDN